MNQQNLFDLFDRLWAGMGGATTAVLRIAVIVIVAWIATAALQRAIRAFRIRVAARMGDRESAKRAETLGRVFRYLVAVVITLVAGMLVLGELGISVAPILGAAGVVGLAVGFGAQSLVKDYFTGFFLLLENQISTGDVVKLSGEHAGFVEEVTLRYVRLRDYDGRVHYVPNSQISSVINMTRGFSFAVLDIGVAYRENVDEVMAVMHEVARGMREDEAFAARILEDLDMAGVDQWSDSAVVIKCRFKVVAMQQWAVKREYLQRLKKAFDERGIEIPYPHLTLYAGQAKDGGAPPLPVQLQRVPRAQAGTDADPAAGQRQAEVRSSGR
ncbi:MAG: mechanosensitive ion channel family protein [Rubrivivax sp.]|nr:mechanosensitive ion channel family protein [Rubrivivax sp.]